MARLLRLEFEGMLDHMMSRGNAREDILLDDEDRTAFLSLNPQRTRPDPALRKEQDLTPLCPLPAVIGFLRRDRLAAGQRSRRGFGQRQRGHAIGVAD